MQLPPKGSCSCLVAIFTYHNQKTEETKPGLHQYQGLAYRTDEGKIWTKYKSYKASGW